VAKVYNQYFKKIKDKCQSCYSFNICTQCIFQMDISSKNTICDGYMSHDDFKKYLSNCISFFERNNEMYSKLSSEVVYE